MTADSSTAAITHSGDHTTTNTTLPSPWAQVVRAGIVPDSIPPPPEISHPVTVVHAPPETSDGGDNNNNINNVVKSAWSKPSANGVVEGVNSPVMGAEMWPALSESTRFGVKSVPESSSKPGIDGSGVISQAPVMTQPLPKQAKPNLNRQRSVRRGGGSAGGGTASVASTGHVRPMPMPPSPPPLPPPFPHFEMYANLAPAVPVPPQPPFKGGNWSARPVDPSLNRGQARRNNFGSRPLNNGYGGRREHTGPRSVGPRDVHAPHQMPPPPPPPFRGFPRPPFLFPRPFRPYGAPMGYEMGAPYVYYQPPQVPYMGGAPVVTPEASASSLHDQILKQIEYYFSDDNLVKDNYLRSHMDDEGWVPIKLIADFRRVQAMTTDIQVLLSSLRDSTTVEIQDDKVRRRADWKKWTHTPREVTEKFVENASLQKLTLEDKPTNNEQVLANGDVSINDPCS